MRKDLRGIIDMSDADHEIFAKWLADHRGPRWIDYRDYIAERKKAAARIKASLERMQSEGLALRHDPGYFKQRTLLGRCKRLLKWRHMSGATVPLR